MALELVTGYAGKAHVTAAQAGRMNVGAFGAEDMVCKTGGAFKAAPASANTVTVADGDAIVNGRHVSMDVPATLSIDSGGQGVVRNDVIAIRYTRNAGTGVEDAKLVVVKGAPSASGAAKDPALKTAAITDGALVHEMGLWRVPIDGVAMQTPEPLFDQPDGLLSLTRRVSVVEGAHDLRWQTLWEGDWWCGKAANGSPGSRTFRRPATGAKLWMFLWSYCSDTDSGWKTQDTGWYASTLPNPQWGYGNGINFNMSHQKDSGGATWSYKYLYLYRDHMEGYKANDEGDNRHFTLRGVYVIY